MNFVDVQPKSFLDYAWTSPSTTTMKGSKPLKAGRRQNRCCDQCRKGKRACDAAILEDTLLENNKSGNSPTVFHYSDVFGPLAACSNCEKTKKTCTFDWLRSLRVSQASQSQVNGGPPVKRRRTQSSNHVQAQPQECDRKLDRHGKQRDSDDGSDGCLSSRIRPAELGVTFGDFACGNSALVSDLAPAYHGYDPLDPAIGVTDVVDGGYYMLPVDSSAHLDTPLGGDSGNGSSLDSLSDDLNPQSYSESPAAPKIHNESGHRISSATGKAVTSSYRKKRRRVSPCSNMNGAPPRPLSITSDVACSMSRTYLTEGLLQIYHRSFENALACWLTSRTCPYSARGELALANDVTPDWNRIYHRVSRLDRLAASIRGRQLTFAENQAASRSLDLAIYAFALQWSQPGPRTRTRFPFGGGGSSEPFTHIFDGIGDLAVEEEVKYDRSLQSSIWHQAEHALQAAGDIESFRVVLAQMVFALTAKPIERDQPVQDEPKDDLDECEDLMAKMNLAIEADGPPLHLEKGLRLIHSLKSRMAMLGGKPLKNSSHAIVRKQYRSTASLTAADYATVDLLFWLAVMFDTLSAATHKRPLVVADEDSNIYSTDQVTVVTTKSEKLSSVARTSAKSSWDERLLPRQTSHSRGIALRWPCSSQEAATLLCEAAPVKVLLFRKVTQIQTLIARGVSSHEIEIGVVSALRIIDQWNSLYGPFLRDCVRDHDRLPSRVQSWYLCLSCHWHLAALLLVDVIEIVDESELGLEPNRSDRVGRDLTTNLRLEHCRALSELARCACPEDGATHSPAKGMLFASQQSDIFTEPWTAVLIRAFAKAGVILLELDSALSPKCLQDEEDAFKRADDCVRALWYLGRKSDMALSAAKILADAVKQRRKSSQEKVRDMSVYLEAELWHGFEGLNEVFSVDCGQ